VGLGIDDEVWNHSVFSKNRDRLLTTEIARDFLAALLAEPKVKRLLSMSTSRGRDAAQAWASMKKLSPEGCSTQSHREAVAMASGTSGARSVPTKPTGARPIRTRLYRKGHGRRASFATWGMPDENRNGLAVLGEVTRATGTAERDAARTCSSRYRQGTPDHAGRG